MVAGLAFLATAVATVFAQATGVRYAQSKAPHQGAWTFALALFALASAALATGASTGWDEGTFKVFYLLGAVLNVPWLALGTVYLLGGYKLGTHVRTGLLVFTGLAAGVVLTAPIHGVILRDGGIPVGKDLFGVFPRVLAAVGSGLGAIVVFVGRGVVGDPVRAPPHTRRGRARERQRAHRVGNARLVERRIAAGRDRSGHRVRDVARDRDHGDLRGVRRRIRWAPGPALDRRRQRTSHDFAADRAGQLVDDLDARRQLVTGELAARVAQELDRVGLRAGSRDDEGHNRLARARMRLADHGDVGHVGMAGERGLDLARIHVESRDDHDVLGAVDDRQPAVGVGHRDVAGVQPAVDEDGRGRRGIVPISREDIGTAHDDLARVVGQHRLTVDVEQADVDSRQWWADRTRAGARSRLRSS